MNPDQQKTPTSAPLQPEVENQQKDTNFEGTKGIFLKILIGCLIIAAVIAVIAVLVGELNDLLSQALATLMVVAFHSGATFKLLDRNEAQQTSSKSFALFINAVFSLIVASFATSLFGLWELIDGELVLKLYLFFFVLLFASLHGDALTKVLKKTNTINNIVYVNFAFMAVVVTMLMPVIFLENSDSLGDVYFRVLSAAGIIDATLTILAIMLDRLEVQKNPKSESPLYSTKVVTGENGEQMTVYVEGAHKKRRSIFLSLLYVYLSIQIFGFFALMLLGL